ncbi:hypothetical protein [Dubosiella newyorkensis]
MSKFSNAAKLISYFGMDPYQYQLGIYRPRALIQA